ncbi:MAG: Gfo/Idh/MocA family oxidoreductase [Acidimicrobiia bacterium]|nr:Gfo/Idh/MocA family oxidoreductase [Acidimicrobiia bacterium]MBV9040036.1 Gfo/Idh/MocA family oxidoreductase [Acidimicrobiia bacterium]
MKAIVVGTGFGCLTHVRAMRAAGIEVVAVVGRDPEKTAARAERFDVPNGLTSLADALALPGVEAAAVATPPHTHAPIVLEAVEAKKHVVCEKPFARDANEAQRMLAAADVAGVVHLLGTEFRWATGQALAARLIRDGAIGEPRLATFILHVPMLADPSGELPPWWADAAEGGGWLGAQAAHVVDQVRTTLGEFEGVSASLPLVADRAMTAEDTYTVHFRTKTGVDGVMQSTAGAYGPPLFVTRVAGTGGTVWVDFDTVSIADADGQRQVEVPDDLVLPPPDPPPVDLLVTAYDQLHAFGIDLPPYTRLYQTFADLIAGRRVPDDPRPATFADGVADMQVLDAIRQSAANQHDWVSID